MTNHTKIFVFITLNTFKDLRHIKINGVNPLYLIVNKMNGYFEEINGNKQLTLVTTNESKEIMEKYKELWTKIKDLIGSKTDNWDDYDEKYMKIKFNLDVDLNKSLEFRKMILVVRAVFHEDKQYYSQVLLDEWLHKL